MAVSRIQIVFFIKVVNRLIQDYRLIRSALMKSILIVLDSRLVYRPSCDITFQSFFLQNRFVVETDCDRIYLN